MDSLEQQLIALIKEQEMEVNKLREENERVGKLQDECQKQLERLNKESLEQEKSKSQNFQDLTKLNSQLKLKDKEIISL